MTKNMPYIDLTLQDLVTKVKALNKSAFAAGFAEKLASLPLDAKRDILAQLYALGVTKQATAVGNSNFGMPPARSVVPQKYIRQNYGLGSQFNNLGKTVTYPDDPKQQGSSVKPPDVVNQSSPLKDMLQGSSINNGIAQLKKPESQTVPETPFLKDNLRGTA